MPNPRRFESRTDEDPSDVSFLGHTQGLSPQLKVAWGIGDPISPPAHPWEECSVGCQTITTSSTLPPLLAPFPPRRCTRRGVGWVIEVRVSDTLGQARWMSTPPRFPCQHIARMRLAMTWVPALNRVCERVHPKERSVSKHRTLHSASIPAQQRVCRRGSVDGL